MKLSDKDLEMSFAQIIGSVQTLKKARARIKLWEVDWEGTASDDFKELRVCFTALTDMVKILSPKEETSDEDKGQHD